MLKFITICLAMVSTLGFQAGTTKPNALLSLPIQVDGQTLQTSVTIDSNWRWIRPTTVVNGQQNCFAGNWVTDYCPDPITCSRNCIVEGAGSASDYLSTYGVSVSGNALSLNYVTNTQYGQNVGSRMYLLSPDKQNYQMFNVLNREFVFTVNVSGLPCGLNGALYFIEMPADGNKAVNNVGAPYGAGYYDAQCPSDIKIVNSWANTNSSGVCGAEYDVWEANAYATQFTAHVTKAADPTVCTDPVSCGSGSNRYKGLTDKDGADFNAYRNGDHSLYGPGSSYKVNTNLPFDVITQFITSDGTDTGTLVSINRFYRQNGVTVAGGVQNASSISAQKQKYGETDYFTQLGGLPRMGQTFQKGMVLALSLWDDGAAKMLWLDSVDPAGSTAPGALRGPCPTTGQDPNTLRGKYPNSKVVYSNIQLNKIGSTPSPSPPTPTPSPVPSPTPSPVPSPTPSGNCVAVWQQCGGPQYTGLTNCCSGLTCVVVNGYYSQCQSITPSPSPIPTPTPSPPTPVPTPTPVNPCPPIPHGYWNCSSCVWVA